MSDDSKIYLRPGYFRRLPDRSRANTNRSSCSFVKVSDSSCKQALLANTNKAEHIKVDCRSVRSKHRNKPIRKKQLSTYKVLELIGLKIKKYKIK